MFYSLFLGSLPLVVPPCRVAGLGGALPLFVAGSFPRPWWGARVKKKRKKTPAPPGALLFLFFFFLHTTHEQTMCPQRPLPPTALEDDACAGRNAPTAAAWMVVPLRAHARALETHTQAEGEEKEGT